ncbi:hypothetical protein MCHI_000076 [Candidatus Magnetoovum chiemensis]|nr:hypothetical protein MCHI_000076 [Candidatus Magnetoovum chiemensis]
MINYKLILLYRYNLKNYGGRKKEMKRGILIINFFIVLTVIFLNSYNTYADTISGMKTKDANKKNGVVKSSPVIIKKPAVIVEIKGDGAGFCLISKDNVMCGNTELVGKTIPAGIYTLNPLIPKDKNRAKVTVYIK